MNSANILVRQSICEALFRLLQDKAFEAIRITEITQLAGVGRVSFYRNFVSKEDVVVQYLKNETWQTFVSQMTAPTTHCIFLGIFHSINHVGDVVDLLYRKGLSHLFLAYIRDCCGATADLDNETVHKNSLIMGICFGALDEWIWRGRQETPEEMAVAVNRLLTKIASEWFVERIPE